MRTEDPKVAFYNVTTVQSATCFTDRTYGYTRYTSCFLGLPLLKEKKYFTIKMNLIGFIISEMINIYLSVFSKKKKKI